MSSASSIVLAPLSVLYGAVTRTRLTLYRQGLLKVSSLAAPVISVGNMTTGGTGKTPLVEWLARALAREGRSVCVLTRGYGRQNPGKRTLVSDGQKLLADETTAGDEPFLLAKNLLGLAAVISDADRLAAGKWAIEKFSSNAFILDDGFQHLRVSRDLNILTIDATDPWGSRHLLPYGRLREPCRGLSRADCIVISRSDQVDDIDSLRGKIEKLAPHRPIFASRMKARGLRRLADQFSRAAAVSNKSIEQPTASFCAIGNPGSFFKQLRDDGFNLCLTRTFSDHHRYDQSDADALSQEAKRVGAKSFVTTAKDAVKLSALCFDLPCYILEIEIAIHDEDGFLRLIRAAIRE